MSKLKEQLDSESIRMYATSLAIVMITSMVWYLAMEVTYWSPETLISIFFIFSGGASTFYLLTQFIEDDECDYCNKFCRSYIPKS